ncbi:MAG: LysR family transcriptional regulator [Desulfosarcina sp.]|nr:LysR family transcriptional regulator [Desulfobacterales bacterium]
MKISYRYSHILGRLPRPHDRTDDAALSRLSMKMLDNKQLGLRSKVWLEWHGRPVMGEGRLIMLQAIAHHGSFLHAAQATGISYRRIRGAVRDMENTIGHAMVRVYRGGGNGGGAELTDAALELMESYQQMARGFRQAADLRFEAVFR